MRIAIPMNGDRLDPHFGHCARFRLIDVHPESKKVVASQEVSAPEHQHGLLPPWLKGQGVTVVIAGGMGAHARSLLKDALIEVITGAPEITPEVLVRQYLDGTLDSIEKPCDHSCHH